MAALTQPAQSFTDVGGLPGLELRSPRHGSSLDSPVIVPGVVSLASTLIPLPRALLGAEWAAVRAAAMDPRRPKCTVFELSRVSAPQATKR